MSLVHGQFNHRKDRRRAHLVTEKHVKPSTFSAGKDSAESEGLLMRPILLLNVLFQYVYRCATATINEVTQRSNSDSTAHFSCKQALLALGDAVSVVCWRHLSGCSPALSMEHEYAPPALSNIHKTNLVFLQSNSYIKRP